MSTVTITRKIQLNFAIKDKKDLKELYKKWYGWQYIVRQGANQVSTHLYVQDQITSFVYLTEDIKVKLSNATKDPDGILNCTQRNSTYKLLSGLYKGKCPMGMLSGLSDVITKTYNKEKKDVRKGIRAVRFYKNNIPMPIRKADTANWVKLEDGNYMFDVYGTKFKTYFGKDIGKYDDNNETNFDKAMRGEYKLCDSSIQLDGKDIFFNAVFMKPKKEVTLDTSKVADCYLSLEYPIIIKENKDSFFNIGSANDYLHKRLQIKEGRRRAIKACKYNQSAHGRKKKFQSTERFEKTEKNFAELKMHEYAKRLIDYCLKRGFGKIVLNNYQEVKEKTHEGTEEAKFLLASWSYYSLGDKIKRKAAKEGIEVEIN